MDLRVQKIAEDFQVKLLRKKIAHSSIKREVSLVHELISQGFTVEYLEDLVEYELSRTIPKERDYRNIQQMVEHIRTRNLLCKDEEYFHQELIIQTPPVRIKREANGEFTRTSDTSEEIFTNIEYYDLVDLRNYFYQELKIENRSEIEIERDISKMKYSLQSYGVDAVLFTIDAYVLRIRSNDLSGFKDWFTAIEFIEEGTQGLKKKRSRIKTAKAMYERRKL